MSGPTVIHAITHAPDDLTNALDRARVEGWEASPARRQVKSAAQDVFLCGGLVADGQKTLDGCRPSSTPRSMHAVQRTVTRCVDQLQNASGHPRMVVVKASYQIMFVTQPTVEHAVREQQKAGYLDASDSQHGYPSSEAELVAAQGCDLQTGNNLTV